MERSVARDPQWPGVARDRLADGVRPRGGQGGERNRVPAPTARELALHLTPDALQLSQPAPGRTASDCAGSTGSAEVAVAVITVCEQRSIIWASARRRSPSSSESTSSSRTSGDRPCRSLSADASARTSASTAIRCSPCEPKTRRSRPPASIRTSCRCGPIPVMPRSRSSLQARRELSQRRRLAVVGESCAVEAELAGGLPERRRETLEPGTSRLDELVAERDDRLRPRRQGLGGREPGTNAAQAGVSLTESRRVLPGGSRAGGQESRHDAVEVRTARSRTALHDGEPVGREDERRQLLT